MSDVVSGKGWEVHHGDALAVLRTMPDASFDALLCDPPAGIAFMGREWDKDKGGRTAWIAWLAEIMREALRCLKPGARALVWSLPRTQHWTMTALEDAGFEITDTIDHIFASGFPKSASVSLLLDRAAGVDRDVVGERVLTGNAAVATKDKGGTYGVQVGTVPPKSVPVTAPKTDNARRWDGYGTALKPAKEVWILCRKPLDGTIAHNVTEHGCGALAIDACRVGTSKDVPGSVGVTSGLDGFGERDGRVGRRESDSGMDPRIGRWPANVVFSHHEDCVRVGTAKVRAAPAWNDNRPPSSFTGAATSPVHHADEDGTETVESWECVDGCPVRGLDEQSGVTASSSRPRNNGAFDSVAKGHDYPHVSLGHSDCGGASRFFATFQPESDPWAKLDGDVCTTVANTSAGKSPGSSDDSSLIGGSGSRRTVRSPRDTKSITRTTTRSTTRSRTSSALAPPTTTASINESVKTIGSLTGSSSDDARDAMSTSRSRPSDDDKLGPIRVIASRASASICASGGAPTEITSTSTCDDGASDGALFKFAPKPSSSERNFGCEHLPLRSAGEMTGDREEGSAAMNSPRTGAGRTGGARNFHPTIKAIKLTKYFATLLLPPARETPRRILTPFAGSGSEMIGAMRAGWEECVGVEQDADFVAIASARLARWEQVAPHLDEAEAVASATEPDERQPSLFDGVGT